MKKTIKIDGMKCEHCSARVENTLKDLGCKNISINIENGIAIIENDMELDNKQLKNSIEDLGFDVIDIINN